MGCSKNYNVLGFTSIIIPPVRSAVCTNITKVQFSFCAYCRMPFVNMSISHQNTAHFAAFFRRCAQFRCFCSFELLFRKALLRTKLRWTPDFYPISTAIRLLYSFLFAIGHNIARQEPCSRFPFPESRVRQPLTLPRPARSPSRRAPPRAQSRRAPRTPRA